MANKRKNEYLENSSAKKEKPTPKEEIENTKNTIHNMIQSLKDENPSTNEKLFKKTLTSKGDIEQIESDEKEIIKTEKEQLINFEDKINDFKFNMLKTDSNLFKINGKVIKKSILKNLTSRKDHSNLAFFSIILFDGEDYLKVNFWKNEANIYYNLIQENTYIILENGQIEKPSLQYKITKLEFEIIVNIESKIQTVYDQLFTINNINLHNLTKIGSIYMKKIFNQILNIQGTITTISEPVVRIKKRQDIFISEDAIEIKLIIWNDQFDTSQFETGKILKIELVTINKFGNEIQIQLNEFSNLTLI